MLRLRRYISPGRAFIPAQALDRVHPRPEKYAAKRSKQTDMKKLARVTLKNTSS
jgi:hypothetical protein